MVLPFSGLGDPFRGEDDAAYVSVETAQCKTYDTGEVLASVFVEPFEDLTVLFVGTERARAIFGGHVWNCMTV